MAALPQHLCAQHWQGLRFSEPGKPKCWGEEGAWHWAKPQRGRKAFPPPGIHGQVMESLSRTRTVAGLQRKPGGNPVLTNRIYLIFSLSFTFFLSLSKSVLSPSKEMLYYSVLSWNIRKEIRSLWSLFGTFTLKKGKINSGVHFKENMKSNHAPLLPTRFHHTLRVFWKAEIVSYCALWFWVQHFNSCSCLLIERTKILLNSDFLNSLRLCYEVFSKWQQSRLWHSKLLPIIPHGFKRGPDIPKALSFT